MRGRFKGMYLTEMSDALGGQESEVTDVGTDVQDNSTRAQSVTKESTDIRLKPSVQGVPGREFIVQDDLEDQVSVKWDVIRVLGVKAPTKDPEPLARAPPNPAPQP